MKVIILCVCAAFADALICDIDELIHTQMYDEATDSSQFRYLASIKLRGTILCSGTFVHDRLVLTTGQCIQKILNCNEPNYNEFSVFFSTTVFDILDLKFYNDYNPGIGMTNIFDNFGMIKVYRVEEFEAECLHPTPINLSTAWIETAETAEIIGWPASPVITFNEALVIKKVLITMLDPSACEMYLGSGPTIEQKMMCGHIMDGETRITAEDEGSPVIIGDNLIGIITFIGDMYDQTQIPAFLIRATTFRNFVDWEIFTALCN